MEQIQLSNSSFEGDNNVYLFAEGDETVLVDTGDRMEETEKQLATELESYDTAFSEIDRIFLTHWHGDHVGLARRIQDESGCEVFIHEGDARLVGGDETAWEAMREKQRRYFDEWGMPEEKQAVLEKIFGSPDLQELSPEVTAFEDGDTFEVNGKTLRVVHAPGHAAGLCMYEVEIDGEDTAITGDALLPKYTPNVGGADVRVDSALAKYLETLRAIVEADYDCAWPGHRDRIDDPRGRAETIIEHHETRSWRVLDALRRLGPSDPWEVSAELFGELTSIHILHGPGEAFAHLEHLQADGAVQRDGNEYLLADGIAEEVTEMDDERWPL